MNLAQLRREIGLIDIRVEILVVDNASEDDTRRVVFEAINAGLKINYIRNDFTISSDENFAKCFVLARGKYVLLLSDDDLFVDGGLVSLTRRLVCAEYGVVCMRAYGYDSSFRAEFPGSFGGTREFNDPNTFLATIGSRMTLISVCVVNKSMIPDCDPYKFCGKNFVQVGLVLHAALRAKMNLIIEPYAIACKRNNSGGYNFFGVFISNLFSVIDEARTIGLRDSTIKKLENHFLVSFYPDYLVRYRIRKELNTQEVRLYFESRFKARFCYVLCILPILCWPQPMAIAWGLLVLTIGRIKNGDFRRGCYFLLNRYIKGNSFLSLWSPRNW